MNDAEGARTSGWLVIGLGNPGPHYANHRHNVGQMVLDVLAERLKARFKANSRARAEVVEDRLGGVPGLRPGVRAVLAKPRSYMNTSGGPVAGLLAYTKVPADQLVVIHDELDLPFGGLRLKLGGGDNGHNGLKSIRGAIGTGDYLRVRFGVGRPPGRQDTADYVLSAFSAPERKELPVLLERAADAVETLVVDGLERAQNDYNT